MKVDKTERFTQFYKKFRQRNYKKGETLIRADDDPQGIFSLTKGTSGNTLFQKQELS